MCPLRFILVFFSAVLAGYLAWRNLRSSPEIVDQAAAASGDGGLKEKQEFNMKRIIRNGFWVFVDMASGKYLWRNVKGVKQDEKVKS